MISIIYAHEPEVRFLKRLIREKEFASKIKWYKWPSIPKKTEGLIINVGFAGGLNLSLALGQVVLVDKVVAQNNKAFVIDGRDQSLMKRFAKDKKIPTASLLTVENPITSITERERLRQETGADIVDMEGRHLYLLAQENDLPIISLKVVSDNADADTWQIIKQNCDKWSEILARTVLEFLKLYFCDSRL